MNNIDKLKQLTKQLKIIRRNQPKVTSKEAKEQVKRIEYQIRNNQPIEL